jgi:hypothetical protein
MVDFKSASNKRSAFIILFYGHRQIPTLSNLLILLKLFSDIFELVYNRGKEVAADETITIYQKMNTI